MSAPGNGLATETIETLAEVLGKMTEVKEMKMSLFIQKLNQLGFKHHPENEERKAWSRNGKGSWVNTITIIPITSPGILKCDFNSVSS